MKGEYSFFKDIWSFKNAKIGFILSRHQCKLFLGWQHYKKYTGVEDEMLSGNLGYSEISHYLYII